MRSRRSKTVFGLLLFLALVWIAWSFVNRYPAPPAQLEQHQYPGGRAYRLTYGGNAFPLAWSPDGKTVAISFAGFGKSRCIGWLGDIGDRATPRALPWWAHLGRFGAHDLLILESRTGTRVREFGPPANTAYWALHNVEWLPDGKGLLAQVVVNTDRAPHAAVFHLDLKTGDAKMLVTGDFLWGPAPSADGGGFALYNTAGHSLDRRDLQARVVRSLFPGFVRGFAWLSDGSLVVDGAVKTGSNSSPGWFLVSPDGSQVRNLVDLAGQRPSLRLGHGLVTSTAGLLPAQEVTYTSSRGQITRLGVVEIHSGKVRMVTQPIHDGVLVPALALGGKCIIYERSRWNPRGTGLKHDLWAVRVSDGKQFRLTDTDDVSPPHVSPDGQRVAFSRHREGHSDVWVLDLDEKAILGPQHEQ